ncbi:MAG TPA: hypothetical protein VFH50_08315 [Acidimicrobiales bacterium]|nr:hypothetical protein [Acidimicrobiales bacterium]
MAVSTPAPLVDRRRLRRAVLVILVLAVPTLVIVRAVKGGDLTGRESNLWLVAVGVVLAAFAIGGFVAARGARDLPLSHSAAAAGYAFVVMAVGSVVAALAGGNSIRGGVVVAVILLGALCVCAAVLGGYAAVWWADRVRNRGVP